MNLVSHKDYLATIREAAELQGWRVWVTWNSKNSPKGEPDLRMVRPPRVIFAEIKVGKDKPTKDQQESMDELAECPGVEVYLWRETDDFDESQQDTFQQGTPLGLHQDST